MESWVAFPGLGIDKLPISRVLIDDVFGSGISIHFYGVIIAIGLILAVVYAHVQAPRLNINRDRMFDVVLVCFMVAIICTRLYYVVFKDPAYYFSHPAKIFAVWDGGLAIYGGIIGAFVSGLIMCRVKKVSTLGLFDLAAVGFLIGQGIGRWGNFFNQEAHGGVTTLPWGMTGSVIGNDPVHPTFLYESLWCLLGALVLHIMFKKCYFFRGQLFASYLIWYGSERVLVEGLRTDSLMLGNTGIRVSQLVSAGIIVLGVTLMVILAIRKHRHPDVDDAPVSEEEPVKEEPVSVDHLTTLTLAAEEDDVEINTHSEEE